ncbi:molybdenum cofactor biosynthesis protein MoaE, partial [Synechococcus sp. H60.3]
MLRFLISDTAIQTTELSRLLADSTAGALVTFEGWVRNHNRGRTVLS